MEFIKTSQVIFHNPVDKCVDNMVEKRRKRLHKLRQIILN